MQITQTTLRSLSDNALVGCELGYDRGPIIEIACQRIDDLSRTKIYIEVRLDEHGHERIIDEQFVGKFSSHTRAAVLALRTLLGHLPVTYLREQEDQLSVACDDWLHLNID